MQNSKKIVLLQKNNTYYNIATDSVQLFKKINT